MKLIDHDLSANINRQKENLALYFWVIILIDFSSIIIGISRARGVGSFFGYSGGMLLALFPSVLTIIGLLVCFLYLYSRNSAKLLSFFHSIGKRLHNAKIYGVILFSLLLITYCVILIMGIKVPVLWYFPEIWIVGNLAMLIAIFLSQFQQINSIHALIISFSGLAFILSIMYFLPQISNYPLAVYWSESSRFYDSSLFFSYLVYGKRQPLPVLDPTRAFLSSFPFIIRSLPIWIHRLWRVILWLGTTFFSGYLLARRIKIKNRVTSIGLILWFMIFSFQGPVYFHLMFVAGIILFGFDKNRLLRSLLFVGVASVWAGLSRVNWFPAAGMLAALLYILEVPKKEKSFWRYWGWPISAVILGLIFAIGAQIGYGYLSGNPSEVFISRFDSPLYWYRLFPNQAYGPGVIFLMLFASFPLFLLIVIKLWKQIKKWDTLRVLAIFCIVIGFMFAGLIVSTKIGGGNNLHNLDAFLIALFIIAVYIAFNRFIPDREDVKFFPRLLEFLYPFLFLVPMVSLINVIQAIPIWDNNRAWEDIHRLQTFIDDNVSKKEEVLFIQDRHLLPFGMIQHVELIPEYDKVFLMEMVMSGNSFYLDQFHEDLEEHKFSVIIMEPMSSFNLSSNHPFGEENNLWVKQVVKPLSEFYTTALDLTDSKMIVLIPKD